VNWFRENGLLASIATNVLLVVAIVMLNYGWTFSYMDGKLEVRQTIPSSNTSMRCSRTMGPGSGRAPSSAIKATTKSVRRTSRPRQSRQSSRCWSPVPRKSW
jgi:hypothetical protein